MTHDLSPKLIGFMGRVPVSFGLYATMVSTPSVREVFRGQGHTLLQLIWAGRVRLHTASLAGLTEIFWSVTTN